MANNSSNLIIDALPAPVKVSLLAHLQPVTLPIGTVLSTPGETPKYAHFMSVNAGVADPAMSPPAV